MQGNEAIKNATSILDYVFRELAVSYLGRTDLAHVNPDTIGNTVMGDGEKEGPSGQMIVSKGLVRGHTDRFRLIGGSGEPAGAAKQSTPKALLGTGHLDCPRRRGNGLQARPRHRGIPGDDRSGGSTGGNGSAGGGCPGDQGHRCPARSPRPA